MPTKLAQIRASLDQKPLSIVAAKGDDTKAEITIYADIGDDMWSNAVSATSFSKEMDKLPASIKEITLRLNSPGGSVFDGMTIYNRLKQSKAKIIVRVDGLAASIASIIALAGDEIIMGEGAFLMIHKPWTGMYGNSDEFEHTANTLLQLEEQMLGIYSRKTKIDREELRTMLRKETWISAEDAVKAGWANKIEGGLPIAASLLDRQWLSKAPRNLIGIPDIVKTEVEAAQAKISAILNKK